MRKRQQSRNRRHGATVVEASVVMVLFLTFLFSIVEYGRYLGLRQAAENAARAGARWALCNTSYNSLNGLPVGDKTQVIQRIRTALGTGTASNIVESQMTGEAINVYKINPATGANIGAWDTASSSDSIAVEIVGQYQWVVPNFLQLASGVWNVRVRVIMRAE